MGGMTEGHTGIGGLRVSDPQVMRALAHPARIEIVEHLNDTGAAVTATEAAGLVGLSPSATSYHLRELAKYGLVEQRRAAGRRERVWRSTNSSLTINAETDTPGAGGDSRADRHVSGARRRPVRAWIERQPDEPEEWRDAGTLMGQRLLLTAEELRELTGKVRELVIRTGCGKGRRRRRRGRARWPVLPGVPGAGARIDHRGWTSEM